MALSPVPGKVLTGGLLRFLTGLPLAYKILARGLLCVLGQSFIVALSPVPGKVLTGGLLCPLVQRIVVTLPPIPGEILSGDLLCHSSLGVF